MINLILSGIFVAAGYNDTIVQPELMKWYNKEKVNMDTPGFLDYIAWAEPHLDMSLKEQCDRFRDVLVPLRRVALVQSYLYDYWPEPKPQEQRALYTIGALTAQTTMGIHAALSTGAPFSAGVQYRTMFELYLSAKLIYESDTQARSDLYVNFEKALKWDHLQKTLDAGVLPEPTVNQSQIESEYNAVAADYASNLTYWWSKILWTPEEAKKRKSIGTKRVCRYLDDAGVSTGMFGNTKFQELELRWYSMFSTLAHGTILGQNIMIMNPNGHRAMGWQLTPESVRLAVLATAACGETIAACTEGLKHPMSSWARYYLNNLKKDATLAQLKFEKGIKIS